MPRTDTFRRLLDALRLAAYCESRNLSTTEALERRAAAEDRTISRRALLGLAGTAAIAASPLAAAAAAVSPGRRIAIVGGGLAGLTCAERLRAKGVAATVYDAGTRVGGRCFSNRTLVAGMACENGGELIDTAHKTMLGYANAFGLTLESYVKKRGPESYHFFGRSWSDEDVVNEFRQVVNRMQPDLHAISGAAAFDSFNGADITFDQMDLATYFASRMAGFPFLEAAMNEIYLAEYGLDPSRQSTLNFLGFMRLNRQSKFEPFGVSDERFHLADGNDGIVQGLERQLRGSLVKGATLTKLARTAGGKYQLYFGSSTPELADAVVIAIPFTVLRGVTLDQSLGLSPEKLAAIRTLGYGTNAKTMIAFTGRPWEELHGAGGGVYSDRPNLQASWESNRGRSKAFGIITDYSSGARGAGLRANKLQQQVGAFLGDYDIALPGTAARAVKKNGQYVAHLESWPTNPLSRGSYTCYTTGQFTSVAGLEGQAAGLLKFAGEHADSFYSWQGFMEGACLSGLRAAGEILGDIKAGAL